MTCHMARPVWSGTISFGLVAIPIKLYNAVRRQSVSFNQLDERNMARIRYRKVDEHSGEEVEQPDIVKAYQVEKGQYIQISDEELEAVALESKKTIEIDEFVPRSEIDELYYMRPYYIVPDGDVGQEAFAVIRESIAKMDKVAIGRVVLTTREHVIAMEPRGNGLMGTLLRYPYEVRDAAEYFNDIQDVKITKDMLDLAKHIVETKAGHFEPSKFEDHYEAALRELLEKKQKGQPIAAAKKAPSSNVYNLMDALRASIKGDQRTPAEKPTKAAKTSQRSQPPSGRQVDGAARMPMASE